MELNIVRIQRDRDWFDKNVPILEAAWKDIEHWRTKDIKTHPEYYDFKYHQPPKKTIDLFFYPDSKDSDSKDSDSKGSELVFLDSDSEED